MKKTKKISQIQVVLNATQVVSRFFKSLVSFSSDASFDLTVSKIRLTLELVTRCLHTATTSQQNEPGQMSKTR